MASTTPQKAKLTLHWLDKSRSHRIVWLLEELGLEYEVKSYKRLPTQLAPPELKKVHPLGKSPILEVQAEGSEPIVIAESAVIVEYVLDHFGRHLIPKQYNDGKEGQVGGETAEWLRYRHFMHYAEGSLMPFLVLYLVLSQLKSNQVPFFIRPISRAIASKVEQAFVNENIKGNFDFIESQLATSPQNGKFITGQNLTGADIMLVFPLDGAQQRGLLTKEDYPKTVEYYESLVGRDAYMRSIKKIEEATGEPFVSSIG